MGKGMEVMEEQAREDTTQSNQYWKQCSVTRGCWQALNLSEKRHIYREGLCKDVGGMKDAGGTWLLPHLSNFSAYEQMVKKALRLFSLIASLVTY